MLRWNDLSEVPPDWGRSVVTLGNFDGVHVGHQHVLATVCRQARGRGARAVAVTFDPHPVAVLHPERAPVLVMSLQERLDAIAATGVEAVLVTEFTRELARQTPEEYVRGTFVEGLSACAVVVGKDTRFGLNNSGDLAALCALGERYGFDVVPVDDVAPAGGRVSSTSVREAVADGDVEGAAALLTRAHRVRGTVVHGKHRGRGLGYPTANLGPDTVGALPADGVYAGWFTRLDLPEDHVDRRLPAAVSVGTNPTFSDVEARLVEAYVLDRDDLELYGEEVAVDFVCRLRGMEKFDSVDELLARMRADVDLARARLLPGR